MVSWERADVVVVTAIELEYAAVLQVDAGAAPGSRWQEERHHGLPVALREFVGSHGRRLQVVVARAPDMGKGSAANVLGPLVDDLHASCVAICGVCAGRPGKTSLGDVVVGERLYDHDAGKVTEDGFEADLRTYSLPAPWKIEMERFDPIARFGGEAWWRARPVPYEWQERWVLAQLHRGVEDPMAQKGSAARVPQWPTVIAQLWKAGDVHPNTRELTEQGRQRAAGVVTQYPAFPDLSPAGDVMPFRVHVAPFATGSPVIEHSSVWSSVAEHMRKVLAIDMEAAALADFVRTREHQRRIRAVAMKGVMDFGNQGRDDHFKSYAARASAECLLAFLRDQLPDAPDARIVGPGAAVPRPGPGPHHHPHRSLVHTLVELADRGGSNHRCIPATDGRLLERVIAELKHTLPSGRQIIELQAQSHEPETALRRTLAEELWDRRVLQTKERPKANTSLDWIQNRVDPASRVVVLIRDIDLALAALKNEQHRTTLVHGLCGFQFPLVFTSIRPVRAWLHHEDTSSPRQLRDVLPSSLDDNWSGFTRGYGLSDDQIAHYHATSHGVPQVFEALALGHDAGEISRIREDMARQIWHRLPQFRANLLSVARGEVEAIGRAQREMLEWAGVLVRRSDALALVDPWLGTCWEYWERDPTWSSDRTS